MKILFILTAVLICNATFAQGITNQKEIDSVVNNRFDTFKKIIYHNFYESINYPEYVSKEYGDNFYFTVRGEYREQEIAYFKANTIVEKVGKNYLITTPLAPELSVVIFDWNTDTKSFVEAPVSETEKTNIIKYSSAFNQ